MQKLNWTLISTTFWIFRSRLMTFANVNKYGKEIIYYFCLTSFVLCAFWFCSLFNLIAWHLVLHLSIFIFGSRPNALNAVITSHFHNPFHCRHRTDIENFTIPPHRCRFHRLKMKWLTSHRAKRIIPQQWPAATLMDDSQTRRVHTAAVHMHAIEN